MLPQAGAVGFVPDESRRKFWTSDDADIEHFSLAVGVGNEMPAPGTQPGGFS